MIARGARACHSPVLTQDAFTITGMSDLRSPTSRETPRFTARLLVGCADRPGIVAAVSGFLFEQGETSSPPTSTPRMPAVAGSLCVPSSSSTPTSITAGLRRALRLRLRGALRWTGRSAGGESAGASRSSSPGGAHRGVLSQAWATTDRLATVACLARSSWRVARRRRSRRRAWWAARSAVAV